MKIIYCFITIVFLLCQLIVNGWFLTQYNHCLEMGILYGFRSLTCKKTGNMLYNDPNGVVGVKVYYATAFQALMQWILTP